MPTLSVRRPARSPASPSDREVRFTKREREFVYGVALKYMKDEEEAHDVAQEAMLLAYRHQKSFRGDSRFTTWLYRVASTTALMHLRKRRRTPLMISTDASADPDDAPRHETAATGASPEEAWASTEALEIAARELDAMGEKYPAIFALRFLGGYSESEIARRLHLNVSTVKTRAYRARAHLRRQLGDQLGDARPLARAA
ncbi:MAG: sigma-70 family RNA polymerase sigma factor [Myxococcales bacterium]|nr:sigma-70 family RNA polymerase sigma factor [Myxococcales bacterium]